jgi:hypothetical protein
MHQPYQKPRSLQSPSPPGTSRRKLEKKIGIADNFPEGSAHLAPIYIWDGNITLVISSKRRLLQPVPYQPTPGTSESRAIPALVWIALHE